MTITATNLITPVGNTTDASSYVTASVTLKANKLYLLAVASTIGAGPINTPTVTGWAAVANEGYNPNATPARKLSVLRRLVTTDTTGTLTIDFAAQTQTGVAYMLVELDGHDLTGSNGSGAIGVTGVNFSDTAVTNLACSVTPFAGASSATIAFFSYNGSIAVTPKSGWTDLTSAGFTVPTHTMQGEFINSNDSAPSFDWAGHTAQKCAIIGIEIKAAATFDPDQVAGWVTQLSALKRRADQLVGRVQVRERSGVDVTPELTRLRTLDVNITTQRQTFLSTASDIDAELTSAEAAYTALAAQITAGGGGGTSTAPALIKGLMGRTSPTSGTVTLPSYNLEVRWSDLQTTQGGAIAGSVGDSIVQAAITSGIPFRLRVLGGVGGGGGSSGPQGAPSWLTDPVLGAGSFTAYGTNPPAQTGLVPRWWRAEYVAAYTDLQNKLAALYDGTISAIHDSPSTVIYPEPFQRQFVGDPATTVTINGVTKTGTQWAAINCANAVAAGYILGSDTTPGTDLWALAQNRAATVAAWTKTRIVLAYNPFQYIGAQTGATNESETRRQMELWYAALGSRHIIQNDSARSTFVANPAGPRPYYSTNPIYQDIVAMHAKGAPVSIQTAMLSRVGDLSITVDWCADMGAHAVELPDGFDKDAGYIANNAAWTTELQANG